MSTIPGEPPLLSFGVIADIQYADADDGYNFAGTRPRYYRSSLQMLDKAVSMWSNNTLKKPKFVLNLGDIIDGKNKGLGISQSSLSTVLQSFSKFDGLVYHIWGNHEFYNFSRKELISSEIYSGCVGDSEAVPGKPYYSIIPHPGLRILALDCYDVSMLASPKGTPEYKEAVEVMKNNPNEDKNSSEGLSGIHLRLAEYNGGLSEHQLRWMEQHLQEAVDLKQNVIVIGTQFLCLLG